MTKKNTKCLLFLGCSDDYDSDTSGCFLAAGGGSVSNNSKKKKKKSRKSGNSKKRTKPKESDSEEESIPPLSGVRRSFTKIIKKMTILFWRIYYL